MACIRTKLIIGVALAFVFRGGLLALEPDPIEFFESKIRPILVAECYECHQTGGRSKGGLILDHRDALRKGGDSGVVIHPGDAKASLLIQAIRHEVEDLEMPKNGARLEESVIADFEKWVAMGAPDPRDEPAAGVEPSMADDWPTVRDGRMSWWSFQPIKKYDPPPGKPGASSQPIDRFINAKLAEKNLKPVEAAGREVLIRRLSFNLRGLPPAPEEIRSFVSDADSAAYEKLVQRYLASPRFGERWARHWMDWLRYADSHGSEGDPMIPNAWRYRDYLIRSLNADVPYDQLVAEHLAGDLLEQPRINPSLSLNESAIGPAHLRMVFHGFAPTDALDELVRFTDDQINVVSKAFMGLTVSCARCHNHKFDPISQADFYSWYGIMASGRPAMIRADIPPSSESSDRSELRRLKTEIQNSVVENWLSSVSSIEAQLLGRDGGLAEAIAKGDEDNLLWPLALLKKDPDAFQKRWKERSDRAGGVQQLDPEKVVAEWDFSKSDAINEWFAEGPSVGRTGTAGDIALRIDGDRIVDSVLPAGVYSHLDSTKDIGVLHSPRIQLDGEYDLWLRIAGDGGSMARYAVQNYPRDGTVFPVERLQGGNWRWKRFPLGYWKGDQIHFEMTTAADQALLANTGAERSWFGIQKAVLVEKDARVDPAQRDDLLMLLYRLFSEAPPESIEELATAYRGVAGDALLAWRESRLTDAQAEFLNALLQRGLLGNSVEQLGEAGELVARYRSVESKLTMPVRVPGQLETVGYDQPLMERGNHKKLLAPVPRRFLEAFDDRPYESETSGRRELANDFLRADNPLTARVIVNRVWNHLFGSGLVRTPDNFGRMGQKPSHPELLDYLAAEFRENGWSIKGLIRQIVLSETWRRDSEPGAEAIAMDPDDVYLSHYPVRRLEAEAIRDALLAVSGQLDVDAMYGPPVQGSAQRRSVYVRVKRNDLDPFLTQFDAPVPASTKGKRDDTNVPGQSLTLLNDPFVLNAADKWARTIERNGNVVNDDARIVGMFTQALGRVPSADELENARAFMMGMNAQRSLVSEQEVDWVAEKFLLRVEIDELESVGRDRVLANRQENVETPPSSLPTPVAAWDFAHDTQDPADLIGGLKLKFRGLCRIRDGALVLDGGNGFAASGPLPFDLTSKTLEAWVKLGDLDQQGGGVFTVQSTDGNVFDSIVIGERQKGQWIAGSDFFRRTQSFDGPGEDEARDAFVHVVATYSDDGTIAFYRNGRAYGNSYKASEPVRFKAGETQVLLGNRHGEPSGGRLLKGRIKKVRLYDRALGAEEIEASFRDDPGFISRDDMLAVFDADERAEFERLTAELTEVERSIENLKAVPGFKSAWSDLAHALFNTKEFIYVR